MIVEVRIYKIKSGQRDKFIEIFEKRTAPVQQSYGMVVFGPLLDIEHPDEFVWLRGFPSLEERERMKENFYEQEDSWLSTQVIPLLESYEVRLCETSPGGVWDSIRT